MRLTTTTRVRPLRLRGLYAGNDVVGTRSEKSDWDPEFRNESDIKNQLIKTN